ncbi:MAG: GAF domain-containing protein, partial [Bacilli bacterium]
NVLEFSGHIACSSTSRSEIVTPIIKNNKVVAIIDLDSNLYNNYTKNDKIQLEKISKILSSLF